jgi:hypothetical protein
MTAIADALVLAVVHINLRDDEEDETYLDQDVAALEGIAARLREATPEELDALAAAAERALAAELKSRQPNPRFVHDYAHWMEETFVTGWEGNQRVDDDE